MIEVDTLNTLFKLIFEFTVLLIYMVPLVVGMLLLLIGSRILDGLSENFLNIMIRMIGLIIVILCFYFIGDIADYISEFKNQYKLIK